MNKGNFIIDVDTGIDDALAMILASKLVKNQVLGITTCGGNVKLEDALANTLKIVELLNWDVPVFAGAQKSTTGNEFVHAYDYHGSNGLCDIQLKGAREPEKKSAVDFIIESAEEGEISIVCLATPTNLAQAISKKPSICKKIKSVFLMGGAINVPGNQTEYAEYNFFQDPFAVEAVLKNIKNCFVVPLDVTNQCIVADSLVPTIKDNGSNILKFVKEAISNWYRFFGYPKKRQFELYDPLTITAAANLDYLEFKDVKMGVNTQGLREGEIFIGGKYAVKLAQTVRAREFLGFFLKNIK